MSRAGGFLERISVDDRAKYRYNPCKCSFRMVPRDVAFSGRIMIHGIVSLLTTWAIVLHALVGCCAHHAHAGVDTVSDGTIVSSAAGCCSSCCSHGVGDLGSESSLSQGGNQHSSDDRGDDRSCGENGCSFFTAGRSVGIDLFLALPVWHLTTNADAATHGTGACAQPRRFSDRGLLIAGDRCARAITQVWQL